MPGFQVAQVSATQVIADDDMLAKALAMAWMGGGLKAYAMAS